MLALQAVFPDISAEEAPPSGVGRQDITHAVSPMKYLFNIRYNGSPFYFLHHFLFGIVNA
jgi:hypothetical protein